MSLLNANLEAFLAITKSRTVQAAAKELGITQTGVTQRLRALEGHLSATLFTRSRRGMMLTHEGQALLRYCQAARDLEGEALAKIQASGLKAEVRVCLTGPTSMIASRLTSQLRVVAEKYPEMSLTLKVSDLESRMEDLKNGVAQFAIVSHEAVAKEMDSKVLRPERYALVAAKGWKKRSLKDIIKQERIADFDPTDQTTFRYLKKYKLHKLMRPERHFVNNNDSLVQLFIAGIGYGVLTLEVADPWLKAGDLVTLNDGAVLENPVALAWYPRPQMSAYFRAIIECVK